MCWLDEVTFYVGVDGTVFYIMRGSGEEWEEKYLQPTFKSGRIVVSVWSCFYGDKMGLLVIIPKGGTMTAKRYLETIKEYFIPFYCLMRKKYGLKVII
jgi:hypothetical protein